MGMKANHQLLKRRLTDLRGEARGSRGTGKEIRTPIYGKRGTVQGGRIGRTSQSWGGSKEKRVAEYKGRITGKRSFTSV